mgnify:FL=1
MVIRLVAILMFFSCSTSLMKDDSSLVKFENAMEYIEDSKYSKAIDELEFLLLIDPLSE